MKIMLNDDDADDPIVWQHGKLLADGTFQLAVCHASVKARLIAEWFANDCARTAAYINKAGIH